MVGRNLCSDEEAARRGWKGSECARRREVLHETIDAFVAANPPDRYHQLAQRNLAAWKSRAKTVKSVGHVDVHPGDWGEVTRLLTVMHGECFAVLNMANAYVPGGAYVEGAVAQEENMYRRTDCHLQIRDDEYDPTADQYYSHVTRLLSAEDGRVYLDVKRPRVCIRGPEDRSRPDLGYRWLQEDEVFPFFELRSAACDLRDGSEFDPTDSRRRIGAQLDTLRDAGIRHVVLGAFGCGAFRNPADRVASIYRDEIAARAEDFTVMAFAIFSPGYGPDNFTPFAKAMGQQ